MMALTHLESQNSEKLKCNYGRSLGLTKPTF